MREEIVRIYWRNNDNPFPGRLVEEKRVPISASERAWHDYVRRSREARLAREMEQLEIVASQFEDLADQACEVAS